MLEEAARATANKLGVGIRLAETLRDLRQDAYDGNIYLPLDVLDQHDLKRIKQMIEQARKEGQ